MLIATGTIRVATYRKKLPPIKLHEHSMKPLLYLPLQNTHGHQTRKMLTYKERFPLLKPNDPLII